MKTKYTTILHAVKGFLDPEEGLRLYEIALIAGKLGPCLEIGSYCGKSAIYIGAACKENNAVLFSIDHHRGSEEQQPGEGYFDPQLFDHRTFKVNTFEIFRKTLEMAGLEQTVVPMVCASEVAARMWKTPLALVFIDGGHSYEAARTDYDCWAKHVMPGGYLLIHDIFHDPEKGGQAPRLVYELAISSGMFEELHTTETLGVMRRNLTPGPSLKHRGE